MGYLGDIGKQHYKSISDRLKQILNGFLLLNAGFEFDVGVDSHSFGRRAYLFKIVFSDTRDVLWVMILQLLMGLISMDYVLP